MALVYRWPSASSVIGILSMFRLFIRLKSTVSCHSAALQKKRDASIKKLDKNGRKGLRKRIKIMYENAKIESHEDAQNRQYLFIGISDGKCI